jgi:hypothetical protein
MFGNVIWLPAFISSLLLLVEEECDVLTCSAVQFNSLCWKAGFTYGGFRTVVLLLPVLLATAAQ